MQSRPQLSRRFAALSIVVVCALPSYAAAQERVPSTPSFLVHLAKDVALDPTTYAPAAIAYDATMRDWNSSQIFFQHGWTEGNARFTVSGFSNDTPIGYVAGKKRILADSLFIAEQSVVNNAMSHVIESALTRQFPHHRKLVRTVGWIERAAFATSMSYVLAEAHYRQWRLNEQRAGQWSPN